MNFDDETLNLIVSRVVSALAEQAPPSLASKPCGADEGHACTADPRPVHAVDAPMLPAMLPRLVAQTSSQIAVGRAGNRFKTDLYLRAREGHADARDAVHGRVPPDWATQNGLVALKTRCSDRREYLLFPNLGRRLDALSAATVAARGVVAPDVQLIVGDGLSPNAIVENGRATLEALRGAFAAAGLRTGVDYYVEYARIAVADEIGVMSQARATVILVGERPGLGTGDSLSVYLAVNPKLGQDNAEKNCISNVRPIGITPAEAASLSVAIVKRGFETGVGGVALGLGWGRQ
ncbi:MAG: ethanolamine ammonia-lyase subunit EutC [Myxococcales bacterium]|nr:ethanolamine ammonia-lyase subunit EutC [Myxococcales bacterium]